MCFSATASFTAGTVLCATGALTLRGVTKPRDRAFAAIPLVFGIQQWFEGLVWLFPMPSQIGTVAAYCFVFVSNVVWPTWIPYSIWLLETVPWRRRVLSVFLGIGILVSVYLLYFLLTQELYTEVRGGSIAYICERFGAEPMHIVAYTPYLLAACVSGLFARSFWVKAFGVWALTTAIFSHYIWAATFLSVWCFFATSLSILVLMYIRQSK